MQGSALSNNATRTYIGQIFLVTEKRTAQRESLDVADDYVKTKETIVSVKTVV